MALQRMDHVSVVVDDLEPATAFFAELGRELEGEASVEGQWVDRVTGLVGVLADIALMRTPDGHGRLELTKFRTPAANSSARWRGTRTATGSATSAALRASSSHLPSSSADGCRPGPRIFLSVVTTFTPDLPEISPRN
jgi:catechol 2,3-dioxygenase-like lactoylglutathione lyase family enzyme